jgi:hypothetical protein
LWQNKPLKALRYALWVTLIGFGLGFIDFECNRLGNKIPSADLPKPLTLIMEIVGWVIGAAGAVAVAAFFVWLIWSAIHWFFEPSEIQERIEALHAVGQATEGFNHEVSTLCSKDGKFLSVVLRLPLQEWNNSLPFYNEAVAHIALELEDQAHDFFVFFIYENEFLGVLPIPFCKPCPGCDAEVKNPAARFCTKCGLALEQEKESCVITMHCRVTGPLYFILKSLWFIHHVFYQPDGSTGFVGTVVTGVCVFLMGLLEKSKMDRYDKYWLEKVEPWWKYEFGGGWPPKITADLRPPRNIAFSYYEITFAYAVKAGCPPLFMNCKGLPFEAVFHQIVELDARYRPFDCKLKILLHWPYGDE